MIGHILAAVACALIVVPLPAWAQEPEIAGTVRITTRPPAPEKWISGSALNGTVRLFKCKPEACSDPTVVAFTFQKGSLKPPDAATVAKFAAVDLPKSISVAVAARTAKTGVVERIETLASAPTTLKGYPSALNETKLTRDGNSSAYLDVGIIFAGPVTIRVESTSPSRELAQKSLNEFIEVTKIEETEAPRKPKPGAPRLPNLEKL